MRLYTTFVLLYFLSACSNQEERPNIVLIFVDDLGYCDSQLYGCDRVPTPNIKRIADDGVLFTAGYVTSPVCSPSRAGLLTGRYQQRFGHEFLPSFKPGNDNGLPPSESTLADAMRDAGYVTGMVGKWHLGLQEKFNPINRGFDEFFGIVSATSDYIDPTKDNVKVWIPVYEGYETPKPSERAVWKGRGNRPVMRGTTQVEEDEYLTEAFTREAVDFINKHRDRSFFLYLPYLAAHGPLQVTQKYYDRFPHLTDDSSRIQAAMISALDDSIGVVLDTLAKNGLDDNTVIFFLSDNGGGVAEYTSNDPLRLGKQTMFEGGVRVPFAMKWPDRIPGGVSFDHPVSSLDVFPTAMVSAGGQLGDHLNLDGVNLIPYLIDLQNIPPHEKLFWRAGSIWAVREENWKLIFAADRYWLYDLANDIGERDNLSDQHPEIVRKLRHSYEDWDQENIEPLWPEFGAKSNPTFFIDDVEIRWAF